MKYFMKITLIVVFSVANVTASAAPAGDTPFDIDRWRAFYSNTVIILLDDSSKPGDGEAIAETLFRFGARAPVVLGTEAVIASVPEEVPLGAISGSHVESVHRTPLPISAARGRYHAQTAITYFNAAVSGALFNNLMAARQLPATPMFGDVFSPPLSSVITLTLPVTTMGATERKSFTPTPLSLVRNSPMDGRIRATLFFVQCKDAPSPGCLFAWTQAAVDEVTNRSINGYRFWGDVGQTYGKNVVFTVVAYSPTNLIYKPLLEVPVEPVKYVGSAARPGTTENYDSLWIDPVMTKFGYSLGEEFSSVRAYSEASRAGGYYSSAFCNFIANNEEAPLDTTWATYGGGTNGNGSYTYLGNFEVTLSDPNARRYTVDAVAAHETGHVFWACDEYYQPGHATCDCAVCNNPPGSNDDRPPGTGVPNANCENGCSGPFSACIMKDNGAAFPNRQICTFTAQHIAWPSVPCFTAVGPGNWSATYYNDSYNPVSGTYTHWTDPAAARYDEGVGFIDHDWGSGSPATAGCVVNSDRFSARYQRYVYFTPGTHTFTATADDGVLVMVDSTTVIDAQRDQPPTTYTGSITFPDPQYGTHLVKVYYFESTGGTTLHVSWN